MLTKRNTTFFSLAVVGFLLVLTLSDFLALHDIQQDYVSSEVLSYLDPGRVTSLLDRNLRGMGDGQYQPSLPRCSAERQRHRAAASAAQKSQH